MVMKEIAAFHATSYHFLQTHKDGPEGFLKLCPDFGLTGWFAAPESDSRKSYEDLFFTFYQTIVDVVAHLAEGKDKDLVPKLEDYGKILFKRVDDVTGPAEHGFNVLNHNDLHMNNILYMYLIMTYTAIKSNNFNSPRKNKNGIIERLVLIDLQLAKYAKPAVDLVYFFGSSTSYKFRENHLDSLLRLYHSTLHKELKEFGYTTELYTFQQLLDDFQDCWPFGFTLSCAHIAVSVSSHEQFIQCTIQLLCLL